MPVAARADVIGQGPGRGAPLSTLGAPKNFGIKPMPSPAASPWCRNTKSSDVMRPFTSTDLFTCRPRPKSPSALPRSARKSRHSCAARSDTRAGAGLRARYFGDAKRPASRGASRRAIRLESVTFAARRAKSTPSATRSTTRPVSIASTCTPGCCSTTFATTGPRPPHTGVGGRRPAPPVPRRPPCKSVTAASASSSPARAARGTIV